MNATDYQASSSSTEASSTAPAGNPCTTRSPAEASTSALCRTRQSHSPATSPRLRTCSNSNPDQSCSSGTPTAVQSSPRRVHDKVAASSTSPRRPRQRRVRQYPHCRPSARRPGPPILPPVDGFLPSTDRSPVVRWRRVSRSGPVHGRFAGSLGPRRLDGAPEPAWRSSRAGTWSPPTTG
jgi:hypothetical protein